MPDPTSVLGGLVSRDRRGLREKIDVRPKIRKVVSESRDGKYLSHDLIQRQLLANQPRLEAEFCVTFQQHYE